MFSNSSAIRISLPTLIAAFGVLAASALAAPPKQKPSPTPSRQKQAPAVEQLDLAQAEAIALRQSPTINAAQFKALAAHQVYRQVRSAFFPQITAESSNVATGDDIARGIAWTPRLPPFPTRSATARRTALRSFPSRNLRHRRGTSRTTSDRP